MHLILTNMSPKGSVMETISDLIVKRDRKHSTYPKSHKDNC